VCRLVEDRKVVDNVGFFQFMFRLFYVLMTGCSIHSILMCGVRRKDERTLGDRLAQPFNGDILQHTRTTQKNGIKTANSYQHSSHNYPLAILIIKLDEYDEHFFCLMPTLFPYNKFTMCPSSFLPNPPYSPPHRNSEELIKRTAFPERLAMLNQQQDVILVGLVAQAEVGFSRAEEEWEKIVVASGAFFSPSLYTDTDTDIKPLIQKNYVQKQLSTPIALFHLVPAPLGLGQLQEQTLLCPTRHPTAEKEICLWYASREGGYKDKAEKKYTSQHPPAGEYRMTENMKAIV
jgi:hypothetical protein